MKPQLFVLKISLLFNVFSFAQSFTVNNLTYTISNTTTVSVSGYNGNVNSVIIPENVTYFSTTYNVTLVKEEAFAENELENVIISNSVITIEEEAFAENELENVIIPNSVITIEEEAFAENELAQLTLGNSLTYIGEEAFKDNNLNSVISLNTNPAILGSEVFDNKENIDLTIPLGTTAAYISAGWTGFKSITEDATLFNDFVSRAIPGLKIDTTQEKTIKSNLKNITLHIYNNLGQQVKNQNLEGVYIVHAQDESGNKSVFKVLIN